MLFLEEITANPLLSPMGGLFISSTFEEGLKGAMSAGEHAL